MRVRFRLPCSGFAFATHKILGPFRFCMCRAWVGWSGAVAEEGPCLKESWQQGQPNAVKPEMYAGRPHGCDTTGRASAPGARSGVLQRGAARAGARPRHGMCAEQADLATRLHHRHGRATSRKTALFSCGWAPLGSRSVPPRPGPGRWNLAFCARALATRRHGRTNLSPGKQF